MNIVQTPTFKKQVKKLHKNQKKELDNAVMTVANNPKLGDLKKGDLAGVQVYKFHMDDLLVLLAYEFNEREKQLILLTFGSHENFYRDLKR
jgi:mRNA-degrading endonuclease RelE of RelBE toxin-antitoxin system